MTATRSAARPRGRPRSDSVDRALLTAAVDEFVANGLQAMTMDGIAARATVSKVSLYRRWRSKREVVIDVLRQLTDTRLPEDRGGLEADVRALVESSTGSPTARQSARILMRTMGEISGDPELLELYRQHLLEPRIQQLRALLARARARRELDDAVPDDVAASLIAGPLMVHALMVLVNREANLAADFASHLVHGMLHGIARPRRPGADEAQVEVDDSIGSTPPSG